MHKFSLCLMLMVQLLLNGCGDGNNGAATVAVPVSGEVTLQSSGVERKFYLQVPADYDSSKPDKPLLFAYHGTGGTYDAWLTGYYDLLDVVGDGAIVVLPQALPDSSGVNQWRYDTDPQFFKDILAYVEERMKFDQGRVFVTGHSSGGGMAHEVGCRFGDLVRGIAPVSGILRSTACAGAVAVFQTHGRYDSLVPYGTGEAGQKFWVLYNGFEYAQSVSVSPVCINHDVSDTSPYPVIWCLHREGRGVDAHDWPGFASAAIWQFFSGLPSIPPGSEAPPPGGGNSRVADLIDTTISFTLQYPAGIGQVTQGSIGLYPAGSQQPLSGGPESILNLIFDPGAVGPGSEMHYVVPIKYADSTLFPGTYSIAVLMYVANGGNPIPYPGRDHIALTDIDVTDRNNPVVIDTPLLLEEVFY